MTCAAQIDSLRSSLVAVPDYRDGFAAEDRGICFVRGKKSGHFLSSLGWKLTPSAEFGVDHAQAGTGHLRSGSISRNGSVRPWLISSLARSKAVIL